ncbi:MAG: type I-E CRISPR-associated protein Cas5/CasD [Anaerolineae bacterium]|nr:type I-E CRISPR-associated protein Cas5/CasD [Anaerolineae bacterium]
MINTLFLRLEGPLQSWGERGRWSVRDTAPEPTKSGLVGLLACAVGLNADEEIRGLSQHIEVGVRVDQPGIRLDDYHTVGGGFSQPQLLTAEGKPKKTPGGEPHTELTNRAYLCNASFLVAVQAEVETINWLARAIQNPHWAIFLGRKCCIPSRPLYEGVGDYPSLEQALAAWPWYAPEAKEPKTVQRRAILASTSAEGIRRRHEIISRSRRIYGPRYTQDKLVTIQVIPEFPPHAPDPKGLADL